MSDRLEEFRVLVDALREARRLPSRKALEDRPLLDKVALLADAMDDDQREIADREGWRGWPDLYDARMKQQVEEMDPDDTARAGDPPRRFLPEAA